MLHDLMLFSVLKNIFFDVDIVVKNNNICCGLTRRSLATEMAHGVVGKITDNTKPQSFVSQTLI